MSIPRRLGCQWWALVFLSLHFEYHAADLLVPLLHFPEFLPDARLPDYHESLAPFVCGLVLAWHVHLVFETKVIQPANEHLLATLKDPFELHILANIAVSRFCWAKTGHQPSALVNQRS